MYNRSELLARKNSKQLSIRRDVEDHVEFLIKCKGTVYTFKLDKEDEDLLDICWSAYQPAQRNDHIYAYTSFKHQETKKSQIYLMHRVVLDVLDSPKVVDHINGDTTDNRKSNLRLVDHHVNMRNSRVKGPNGGKYPRGTWLERSRTTGKPRYWYVQVDHRAIRYNPDTGKRMQTAREAYDIYIREKIRLNHYPDLNDIPTFEDMCPDGFVDPLEKNVKKNDTDPLTGIDIVSMFPV